MNSKLHRILFPILSFVTLVALACTCGGAGADPTATPEPPPTNPPPTKPPVEIPTEPLATKPPIGGDNGNTGGGGSIVLGDQYVHPSGTFAINFPVGWEISEYNNSAAAYSPDGTAAVTVYFENAGYELDSESFTNYINAIEANFYASYDNYQQSSVEPQSDGSVGVFKSFDFNGVPQSVSSYYWQDSGVLFIQDWWVDTDLYDALSDGLLEVSNSMSWDGSAGTSTSLFPLRYTYNCPGQLCTFDAPYGWRYSQDTSYNNTVIDQFQSPDKRTFIENVVYDDGTAISKSVAGQFALGLLKEFYKVSDIVVTADQVQSDGSERLDWYSPSGGYTGESFFETRGTTFLMLTWVVNNDYYDFYTNVWGEMVSTYTVP